MTTVTEIVDDNGVVNVSQGASIKVRAGVDFCIRCNTYLGDPEASEISWRRRSVSGTQNEGIDISDVCITFRGNGTLLCFTDITTSYDDTYTCFVSNEAGSDSGNVTVQVSGEDSCFFILILLFLLYFIPPSLSLLLILPQIHFNLSSPLFFTSSSCYKAT